MSGKKRLLAAIYVVILGLIGGLALFASRLHFDELSVQATANLQSSDVAAQTWQHRIGQTYTAEWDAEAAGIVSQNKTLQISLMHQGKPLAIALTVCMGSVALLFVLALFVACRDLQVSSRRRLGLIVLHCLGMFSGLACLMGTLDYVHYTRREKIVLAHPLKINSFLAKHIGQPYTAAQDQVTADVLSKLGEALLITLTDVKRDRDFALKNQGFTALVACACAFRALWKTGSKATVNPNAGEQAEKEIEHRE